MAKPAFPTVWRRITEAEGQEFRTKRGIPFGYHVEGDAIRPTHIRKYLLGRSQFEAAYALAPYDGPGVLNDTVRGPAYVWAILHDSRIRKSDW